MIYHGTVTGGVVVLEGGVTLPDGTPVRVEALGRESPAWPSRPGSNLADLLDEVQTGVGLIDGPADWAAEHDHYLYGAPKQCHGRSE